MLELRSWEEAETRILGLIEECAETGINRLGEALGLAEEWGLDQDWVRERFREAESTAKEKLRKRAKEKAEEERAAALKKRPAAQPPVIEPAETQPAPKKNPMIAPLAAEFKRQLRIEELKAKAKALAEAREAASEQPEPEPERVEKAKPGTALARIVEGLKPKHEDEEEAEVVQDGEVVPAPALVPMEADILLPALSPPAVAVPMLSQKHAVIGSYGSKAAVLSWETLGH